MFTVRQASLDDANLVAPLFDAYRQFYGKAPDPDTARSFIQERLANGESTVLIAVDAAGKAVGFTQLYPTFSSVSAARVYTLNDLFVAPEARRANAARQLMRAAGEFCRGHGALRMSLSTGKTNEKAQALYASEGWVRDDAYYHYSLTL
jgi:GNAT superfamily N-acetyltransferase